MDQIVFLKRNYLKQNNKKKTHTFCEKDFSVLFFFQLATSVYFNEKTFAIEVKHNSVDDRAKIHT